MYWDIIISFKYVNGMPIDYDPDTPLAPQFIVTKPVAIFKWLPLAHHGTRYKKKMLICGRNIVSEGIYHHSQSFRREDKIRH